jgi:hypothetical protein
VGPGRDLGGLSIAARGRTGLRPMMLASAGFGAVAALRAAFAGWPR